MPKLSVCALVGVVTLGVLLGSAISAEATCYTFHNLSNGSTADATQVMDNFNYILTCPNFTGNVGIGNASPTVPLSVVGGAGITGQIVATDNSAYSPSTYAGVDTLWTENLSTTAGTGSGIGFMVKGAGPGAVASIAGISTGADYSTALVFQTRSSAGPDGEKMRITSVGNVGIGTTTPSYVLHVNGTAYATGAAGALSDKRHKTNIEPLSLDAIAVVAQLHPVTFNWKDPKDEGMRGRQTGFIAQDVQTILPSFVLTMTDREKTLGLKYNEFIPLLTGAIQQQQAQIRALKDANRVEAAEIARLHIQNAVVLGRLEQQVAQVQDVRSSLGALEHRVGIRTAADTVKRRIGDD